MIRGHVISVLDFVSLHLLNYFRFVNYVEIQQEEPSENYPHTLGWSLRQFLGGSLFLDDEQILFIDGERILFIDVC